MGYKGKVNRAFSEQLKERARPYAVRGGGSTGLSRSRLGGVRDVPAGASLAVSRDLYPLAARNS